MWHSCLVMDFKRPDDACCMKPLSEFPGLDEEYLEEMRRE